MLKKILLCLSLALCITTAFSQNFPEKPTGGPVADFTGTLSADNKQQLNAKLKAFEDSTSNQIAVVLIATLGDYEINDYGVGLMRKWGIGQKDKNNGVLVLVSLQDRKMSIQTGYGLEGALPDITTQEIIQNDMRPHFKEGDFYGGLDAAVNSIIAATKGEYKGDNKATSKNTGKGGGGAGFVIIIVIIIFIIVFRNRGGGGGGRRIIGGRGGSSPFWWFLAGNMLGGSGRSSGSDWGGFSGGGGGGGSSWGGFGGGSTGGGGSSGSW